jgi:hypothetical protein
VLAAGSTSGRSDSPQSLPASATVTGGGGGSGNTLTLSNAPVGTVVLVTDTTLNSSSTYDGISSYVAIGTILTGTTASLTWTSGGTGTYNVLAHAAGSSATRYKNGVSFTNGSASLDWNSMSAAGGGGGSNTLTITGLPSGYYAVYAITKNPSTYQEVMYELQNSPGIGAIISGTTVTWSVTPPNDTYTIILGKTSGTEYYKAANVTITNGGGSVAYNAFSVLPLGI